MPKCHLLASAALFSALVAQPVTASAVPAAARAVPAVSPSVQLNAAFDAILKDLLRHSPQSVTALGLDRTPNGAWAKRRLDPSSLEEKRASAERTRGWIGRIRAIDRATLTGADAVNYDAVLFQLEVSNSGEARFDYGVGGVPNPYVVSQLNGAYREIPDLLSSQHKIESADDAEAYLARLAAFAGVLDDETQRIKLDAAAGVVPPRFIIGKTLEQLRRLRTGAAAESPLVTSLASRAASAKLAGDWAARATAIVDGAVSKALDRQIAALEGLMPKAGEAAGVWRLPNGSDYYAFALRYYTTTDLSADAIHAMGLAQVARISAEIDAILKSQGLADGTVGARLAALGEDPRQLYPNTAEGKAQLLADLNADIAKVSRILPDYFGVLPKARVEVKRVPELIEAGAPGGYYMVPALDGSRPGEYYINLRDTAEWPKWTLPTLSHHEAVPGHHLQNALAQEAEGLPPLRQVLGNSAYGEGWGLYAEQLADEAGMYSDDPLGRVGYLQSLLFRAARLVVDTGLHHKRWSREQAIRYMVDTLGDQESSVATEVDRYIVNPGQAASYKIGHSKWVELRERAKQKLGPKFDLKSFHDVALGSGDVPLAVLERVVDDWIAETSTRSKRPKA